MARWLTERSADGLMHLGRTTCAGSGVRGFPHVPAASHICPRVPRMGDAVRLEPRPGALMDHDPAEHLKPSARALSQRRCRRQSSARTDRPPPERTRHQCRRAYGSVLDTVRVPAILSVAM